MNSGVAKGAHARGKRIAFGDGKRIIWHANARHIFAGNPNVAFPGSERDPDIEWYPSYPGNRPYHLGYKDGVWTFNPDFRAIPGEVFFTASETMIAKVHPDFDVIIEPSVKSGAPNKQWPVSRYQKVASALRDSGFTVGQFVQGAADKALFGVRIIHTPSFRNGLAMLAKARLYIGAEGGLHHGAAALGKPAVVLFGGFTHPRNTGYDLHTNIFVGEEPCGRQTPPCDHCKRAMDAISVDQVVDAALEKLGARILRPTESR